MVERLALDQVVGGSSPSLRAMSNISDNILARFWRLVRTIVVILHAYLVQLANSLAVIGLVVVEKERRSRVAG